jgi:hypothetical protein
MAASIPVQLADVKSMLGIDDSVSTYNTRIASLISLYDEALEAQIQPAYLAGTASEQALIRVAKTEIIAARAYLTLPPSATSSNIKKWSAGGVTEEYGDSSGSAGKGKSGASYSEKDAWEKISYMLVDESPYRKGGPAPAFAVAEPNWNPQVEDHIVNNALLREGL